MTGTTLMKEITLEYERLFEMVQYCKDRKHFQQVAYSVHKNVCTQICFACKEVRHTKID